MFRYIASRLSVEVVLIILLITFIPAMVVGYISVKINSSALDSERRKTLSSVCDSAVKALQYYFNKQGQLGRIIAKDPRIAQTLINYTQPKSGNGNETANNADVDLLTKISYFKDTGFNNIYVINISGKPEIIYPINQGVISQTEISQIKKFSLESAKSKRPIWWENSSSNVSFMLSLPASHNDANGKRLALTLETKATSGFNEVLRVVRNQFGHNVRIFMHGRKFSLSENTQRKLAWAGDEKISNIFDKIEKHGQPQGALEFKTPNGNTSQVFWRDVPTDKSDYIKLPEDLRVIVYSPNKWGAQGSNHTVQKLILVAVCISCFMAVVGYLFVRPMVAPIVSIAGISERVRQNDFKDIEIDSKRLDEIGVMVRAFREMLENMKVHRKSTTEGVGALATSASEITATATQLRVSTTRTSSAVSETSTTAEEVKQAAYVSNDKAKQVYENSIEADEKAHAGLNAAEDMAMKMTIIKNQMDSINNVIKGLMEYRTSIENSTAVVADISDQSNILAVNAAIEAVRAGELGHGFGVVAQEIKDLADQSKQATNLVSNILKDAGNLINQADKAAKLTNEAVNAGSDQAKAVKEVIDSISKIVSIASQDADVIKASSEQQFVGIDQLAQAMANIDEAMAQNMSATEQLEAEALKLEELGARLKELVTIKS